VGFQWLMARPQSNPGSQIKFTSIYLAIFVAAFVSYWFIGTSGFVQEAASSVEVSDLVNIAPPVEVSGGVGSNVLVALAFIKDNIAKMLFLFFAWLGFAYLLSRATNKTYITPTAIGLLGLLLLIVYLPNPLHLLPQFTDLFLIDRIPLLLTVFMSLAMAYGVVLLAESLKKNKIRLVKKMTIPIIIVLMVAFLFFSVAAMKNASDIPSLRGAVVGRHYFTVAELSALSFVQQKIPSEITLYSDYYARRYFVDLPTSIIAQPDVSYIEEGWVLLRTGELEDRWLLFWQGGTIYKYNLEGAEPKDDIFTYLARENKVYDDGTSQSYIICAK